MSRPARWDDYIGQEALKDRLQTHITSALHRVEPLPHVLLVGPPGCGKTTLANLIAQEMREEENFAAFVMPIDPKLFMRVVRDTFGIAFFDELHRLPPRRQEDLLTVIEDNYLQTPSGARIENNDLTIIAATTEGDKIIKPLYDRFPIRPVFDPYTDDQMAQIVFNMARREDLRMDEDTAMILGAAAFGVPRRAKSLVVMARDLKIQNGTMPTADEILAAARITVDGLGIEHIRYCEMLQAAGGTAGLDLMRMLLGMPAGAIEALEIDLIRKRMIERTPSGRTLTGQGYRLVTLPRRRERTG